MERLSWMLVALACLVGAQTDASPGGSNSSEVPVDVQKMIAESAAKAGRAPGRRPAGEQAESVDRVANKLMAQEVNASDAYAKWDQTKADLMQVNKQFPIEPIVIKRCPRQAPRSDPGQLPQ